MHHVRVCKLVPFAFCLMENVFSQMQPPNNWSWMIRIKSIACWNRVGVHSEEKISISSVRTKDYCTISFGILEWNHSFPRCFTLVEEADINYCQSTSRSLS
mmetsp:Transcript_28048/g.58326  ORF Transcript_28048/g.58326 Transcript_28048/m.58326 type:complete len:101 (+) Transcript_28048:268-570(+)